MSPKRIVLAGGCFDVLHFGHLQFLKAAKQQGDLLVIALESDEFIRIKKHRSPVHSQLERQTILEAVRYIDRVIPLVGVPTPHDYQQLVIKEKPAIIAVTEGDLQMANKEKMANAVGAKLVVVTPLIKNISTSAILSHTLNN